MADPVRLPAPAYVYVIGAPDGPQKIGVAADPTKRMALLQVGNPAGLGVSAAVPTDRHLAYEVERYAHWMLRDQCVRGEWFDVSPREAAAAVEEAARAVRSGFRLPRGNASTPEVKARLDRSWQRRAKDAGLSQVVLARLLGRPVNTISRQIRGENGGVPQHLMAVIVAWEVMTPDQRDEWMASTLRAAGLVPTASSRPQPPSPKNPDP